MNNPYEVLGVSKSTSEEEIRNAYKSLVKKYHPDKYHGNPLADLAEEKLKEINEAYDQIKSGKASGASYSSSSSSSGSYSGSSSSQSGYGSYGGYDYTASQKEAKYRQVISYINSMRYNDAYTLLSAIKERDSEWYYLSSIVVHEMGWKDQALQYINTALSMEPGRPEYTALKNKMLSFNNAFRTQSYGKGYSTGAGCCDTCTCLCCADSLCECLGGDLISCC